METATASQHFVELSPASHLDTIHNSQSWSLHQSWCRENLQMRNAMNRHSLIPRPHLQKAQRNNLGFSMTEMLVAVSAGVLIMGAGSMALRSTGGLISDSKQRAVLRQNTNNGMRLLRSEVERSLHLIVNSNAQSTPEGDAFHLGSKRYEDLLSHCRQNAPQSLFVPAFGIKMASTELIEPVLYGFSVSPMSSGYSLMRCGAPMDDNGAYIQSTSTDKTDRKEFLGVVIDNIAQMDCAKTTDDKGNTIFLDTTCDGAGNDDLEITTSQVDILQAMQNNIGEGEGLLFSTNTEGEIVTPEVSFRQPALRIQTDSTLKLLKFIDPNPQDQGRTYSYLALENSGKTTTTQPLYLAAYARADKRLGQYGSDEGLQNITIFQDITSDHIRFVLDGSGSMSACIIWDDKQSTTGSRKFWNGNGYIWTNQVCSLTRMETLIDELYALVSALKDDTKIGLEMFSSSSGENHNREWTLSKSNLARLGDSGVRESAQQWVIGLDDVENVGNWGGTIPWPALKRAFADEQADTVYFLSDGIPNSFSNNGLPSNVSGSDEVVNYFSSLNTRRDEENHPKLIVNTIALGLTSDWMKSFSERNNGKYMQYDSESLSEVDN